MASEAAAAVDGEKKFALREVDEEVDGILINASGHVQELERNFNFWSICSVGIVTGNTWAAYGGGIVIALYNGGPPGMIYELLVVSFFYWLIAACIAELASAIPSSAGVYQWATVTAGPKWGKAAGFFAGWWNSFAWLFGATSINLILANQIIAMWGLFHPDYVFERWHGFIVYLIMAWVCVFTVMFGNRALPYISQLGLFLILAGVLVTILVCAIMPSTTGTGYASNSFVWSDWENQTGYTSDGFVFLAGMLNGAFAVGTPDCISHLAEEIPNPRRNIPRAIGAQMVVGLVTAFLYLIPLLYSINDPTAVFENPYTSPLAEIYRQATNSRGGALGLLLVIFMPTLCCCIGAYITAGRMLWALARDEAVPFSSFVKKINSWQKNPMNATAVTGIVATCLGCIYIGSATAFNAFAGSFVVLTTLSYLTAILPHLLTRRRYVTPGEFWMKDSVFNTVAGIACAYIAAFIVIYCFPYSLPVTAENMNYACLITGGLTIFVTGLWFWKRNRGYVGPPAFVDEGAAVVEGRNVVGISADKT
ncbi:amino acid transporter [Aulographum hederae CBS 113979]|uniref:Amino acid transporter n=1 Tax=Aulographum hederae CBS 113979 TaxID=1176131 RepID=A0A6G1H608_9PEZI|nr:amino acid transporter [Aulographum hederae CBS 113979]